MTKTFCDRCGKEIQRKCGMGLYAWITHKVLYAKIRMVGLAAFSEENNWISDDKYICPECEESYIHWFMNPDNDRKLGGNENG